MHIDLAVRFADVRADALRWQLGLAPQPALAVHRVRRAGRTVELRVLGASHQVVVDGAWSETVACLGEGCVLPQRARRGPYRLVSRVDPFDGDRLAAVLRQLARRDDALVGVFPGETLAVTALALDRRTDRLGWRTWHAYPQTGELVVTRTRLVAP